MSETPSLRLAVIIGSTREGRVGARIGAWFARLARRQAELSVQVVDLADYNFPARHPRTPTPAIDQFTAEIGRSDAFVIVTPEYNRSYPASLKQAIDYAYDEWRAKPVGFVSYGSGSVGSFAVEHLRTVFAELHATTVHDVVGLDLFSGDDPLSAASEQAAESLLDQIAWWGRALRDARTLRPYVC